MNNIDKQNFENNTKKVIYNDIINLSAELFQSKSRLEEYLKIVGYNKTIPNTAVTINNKIVELSNKFKNEGISMFVSSSNYFSFVYPNFIGDAVIKDLMDKLDLSVSTLSKLAIDLESIFIKKEDLVKKYSKLNNFNKKLFSKLGFNYNSILLIDKKEKSIIDDNFNKYIELDNNIWNYTLEENVVSSLSRAILMPLGEKEHLYSEDASITLIENEIEPDLVKLHLDHKLDELKETLKSEYTKKKTL